MMYHGANRLSNLRNPISIETHELSRSFGKQSAVEKLSIRIPTQTIFGFLGPNGAGKTTTIRMLTGLIQPSSGSATVGGYQIGPQSTEVRQSVGLLTESPGLYEKLTPIQNLAFFAQMYGLDRAEAARRIEQYLRLFELWDRRDDPVSGFSKGMRQKIAITRALLHDPPTVFLDEPTAGLDPEAALMVRDLVRTLRSEGRTVFLTTHNLQEVEDLCDSIAIFRTRLLAVGKPDELRDKLFGRGTIVEIAGAAEAWIACVQELSFVRSVSADRSRLQIMLDDPSAQNPLLVQTLVQAGAPIRFVEPLAHSLEQVYLELIGTQEASL